MMLDTAILQLYHVTGATRDPTPVTGLTAYYSNWCGERSYDASTGGMHDQARRVRIHDAPAQPYDVALLGGQYWVVDRVYHGTDDDTGLPIADITLRGGDKMLVPVQLIPRLTGLDDYGAPISTPNTAAARMAWAIAQSIADKDLYAANAAGITLDAEYAVYNAEYDSEAYITVAGTTYEVRQTYPEGQVTRLVCSEVISWPG